MKLKVISVQSIAFNDQKITAKSDDATMHIHLHNQKLHGSLKEGDEIELPGKKKKS